MNSTPELPWLGRQIRIAVIGDLILDEYLDGDVTRISPEAPVPVHLVSKLTQTAGGAANVARNIQLVGADAELYGVWGQDQAGEQLRALLVKDGVDCRQIIATEERSTVKKTRIYARNQQLVRIDWEQIHPISETLQTQLLANLEKTRVDAILVSDYGKGTLTEAFLQKLIAYANSKGIPVVVDPKGHDYTRYRGCRLITPNRKETCQALGLDESCQHDPRELARSLQKRYGLQDVLVTLGAEGMMLLNHRDDSSHYLPAEAREVYDVSGAGDTVAAVMTLGIASGCNPQVAMRFANIAAGLVVEKLGTQPIHRTELEAAMEKEPSKDQHMAPSRKILDLEKLLAKRAFLKEKGKKVVMTNGCFDILHAGHVKYLQATKSLGDYLVVAVNTDESVRRIKGEKRPVITLEHRLEMLAALSCIDYVISFDHDTPSELIDRIVPDVLVKGADWAVDDIVGGKTVIAAGGAVKNIELVHGLSTTNIIEKIKSL